MKNPTVSLEQWTAARTELLQEEKELTRRRAELAAKRRALPWLRIEKRYLFEGPDGPLDLARLSAGKRQLLVQHFMFGPTWQEGCPGCSFVADHHDAALGEAAHGLAVPVGVDGGDEILIGALNYLDFLPLGRQEGTDRLRHKDRY